MTTRQRIEQKKANQRRKVRLLKANVKGHGGYHCTVVQNGKYTA